MRKILALALAGLVVAGMAIAVPVAVREYGLLVTDGATTANYWTMRQLDVDTTATLLTDSWAWPEDNSKPLGTLVVRLPKLVGQDLDSIYVKSQWCFNDSSWIGARYDTTPLAWDTTRTDYNVSYSYVYGDTTAGQIWPFASAVRFLLYNGSNSDADGLDTLSVVKGTFIVRRAD